MSYEITGKTKLTALLGSPVSHSISPQMHNEAFRELGLDYVYLAFDKRCNNRIKGGWHLWIQSDNALKSTYSASAG